MRKGLGIILLLCSMVGCAAAGAGIPARPDELGMGEIEFDIPDPVRWVLPNGLTVHYLHDAELPLVSGMLIYPGGSLWDPATQSGLASITGSLMREGSVQGISPENLDKRLDNLAAAIESNFLDEYGSVKFSSLSADFDEVFELFARVVQQPAFDGSRLNLLKMLATEGINRRRDDPGTMATMAFMRVVYGPDTPYSRAPSVASIKSIDLDSVQRFHRRFVRPDRAHLALRGAVPLEKIRRAVETHFGSWAPSGEQHEIPTVNTPARPGVYVLEREFNQATVIAGHLGPPRLTPDQHAISVYNRIFGQGGFGTILLSEIRTKLGLVYSIYGGLMPGAVSGVYEIDLQTRNEAVVEAVRKVLELVKETGETAPTRERLNEAKLGATRSFVFRFDSSSAIVVRRALMEFLGYPPDFDDNYIERINEVGAAEVLAVAQRWVRPEDLAIVVVGGIPAQQLADAFGGELEVYRLAFGTEPHILDRVTPADAK